MGENIALTYMFRWSKLFMIFPYSLQICMDANFDPQCYIKYNGNIIIESEYLQQNIR